MSLCPTAHSQTDADNAARLAERLALNVSAEIRAKCEKLLADWKDRFDEEKFNYLVAAAVRHRRRRHAAEIARYRDGTILAAARCAPGAVLQKQPAEPVLILLFEIGRAVQAAREEVVQRRTTSPTTASSATATTSCS